MNIMNVATVIAVGERKPTAPSDSPHIASGCFTWTRLKVKDKNATRGLQRGIWRSNEVAVSQLRAFHLNGYLS